MPNKCFAVFCILVMVFFTIPGQAQLPNETQDEEYAKPIDIPEAEPSPIYDFAPPRERPAKLKDSSASPNPTIPMVILDAGNTAVNQRIPLMEDTDTTFTAASEIFSEVFPASLGGGIYKNARWIKPPSLFWTINSVKAGTSEIGNSTTGEYRAFLKNPGEYLISCFADRDFAFTYGEKEMILTALSSRGIGCFVADATPPDITIMVTEYGTMKRTTFGFQESPVNGPPGSKTYELSWDGIHFDLGAEERKTGTHRGYMLLKTGIDLGETKFPPLVLKKDVAYLLNVEGTDNFQVKSKDWTFVDYTGKSILDSNIQRFSFPADKAFLGKQNLVVRVTDMAGNFNELKIPLRIVPK